MKKKSKQNLRDIYKKRSPSHNVTGYKTNRPINTKTGKSWNSSDGETRDVLGKLNKNGAKHQKNYATTTSQQQGCYFRRDYSYLINNSCSKCKFCYSNIYPPLDVIDKTRNLQFKISTEIAFSDSFAKSPIVISKNCDPFANKVSRSASYVFMKRVLQQNGQIILKTARRIYYRSLSFLFSYYDKKDILFQLRVICDDTITGAKIREDIAPRFMPLAEQLNQAKELIALGYDVSFIIDPYIIGINDTDTPNIIRKAYDIGVRKFTIKQLFATDYFKKYLLTNIGARYVNILSDYYFDKYYTYDNLVFMNSLLPTLELIKELGDVYIGICCNKTVNELVCNHDNCCCFDNPIGIYNRDISPMVRGNKNKPLVIQLRDRVKEKEEENASNKEKGKEE